MQRSRLAAMVLLLMVTPLAGCASSGQSGSSSSEGSRDVLTREQLSDLDNLSAYDAVSRLRSTWVRSPRYSGIRIYLDGILQGGVSALRSIQTKNVEEIRFLDPRQATMEFGTGHRGGALLIKTRR